MSASVDSPEALPAIQVVPPEKALGNPATEKASGELVTDEAEAKLAEAGAAFAREFPNHTPREVFQVLANLGSHQAKLVYPPFRLAYPEVARHMEILCDQGDNFFDVMSGKYRKYWTNSTYDNPFSTMNKVWSTNEWRFRSWLEVPPSNYYHEWSGNLPRLREASRSVGSAWEALKAVAPQVQETSEVLEKGYACMEANIVWLSAKMVELDEAEVAARNAYEAEQHNKAAMCALADDHAQGLNRTSSSSTALEIPMQPGRDLRGRSPQPHRRHKNHGGILPPGGADSPPHRLRELVKSQVQKVRKNAKLEAMGDRYVAYCIVLAFSVAGAATTALAVRKCAVYVTKPMLDGNFWSTMTQALIALPSVYCIIIPILRRAKVNARDPRLFRGLLVLSCLTTVGSVVAYPYDGRASSVLGFVSSVAQLAATLQLIEDSTNKIEVLKDNITDLNEELIMARMGR